MQRLDYPTKNTFSKWDILIYVTLHYIHTLHCMENAFPNVWLKFIHETNPSFPEHCQPNSCILVTHKATAELLTSTCAKLLVAPLKTTTTKKHPFSNSHMRKTVSFRKKCTRTIAHSDGAWLAVAVARNMLEIWAPR